LQAVLEDRLQLIAVSHGEVVEQVLMRHPPPPLVLLAIPRGPVLVYFVVRIGVLEVASWIFDRVVGTISRPIDWRDARRASQTMSRHDRDEDKPRAPPRPTDGHRATADQQIVKIWRLLEAGILMPRSPRAPR
jgi:hypothetical protein